MSKPFFEVFPNLQLNTDIHDLMGQTEVERVSATKRRDFLRVYLKSTRLIQKADIWTAEQEIKKQLFPDANLTVKIYEKFELSSQYNPEKLMDIYKGIPGIQSYPVQRPEDGQNRVSCGQ